MCNAADLLAKLAVAGNPEIIRAGSRLEGGHLSISSKPVFSQSTDVDSSVATNASMRTQLISYRLPKADSALLRSSLFHHLCRFVSFSSDGFNVGE